MNRSRSSVCCRSASLCSSDGATHWTEWPKRCSSRKHCISNPTSGSITIRKPSKMPVRGGSRSRYSSTKPCLTTPDVALPHRLTRSSACACPTRRAPTISCPGSIEAILDETSREQRGELHENRRLVRCQRLFALCLHLIDVRANL